MLAYPRRMCLIPKYLLNCHGVHCRSQHTTVRWLRELMRKYRALVYQYRALLALSPCVSLTHQKQLWTHATRRRSNNDHLWMRSRETRNCNERHQRKYIIFRSVHCQRLHCICPFILSNHVKLSQVPIVHARTQYHHS